MSRRLEDTILSLRGGLFIWRELEPLFDKATDEQVESVLNLLRKRLRPRGLMP